MDRTSAHLFQIFNSFFYIQPCQYQGDQKIKDTLWLVMRTRFISAGFSRNRKDCRPQHTERSSAKSIRIICKANTKKPYDNVFASTFFIRPLFWVQTVDSARRQGTDAVFIHLLLYLYLLRLRSRSRLQARVCMSLHLSFLSLSSARFQDQLRSLSRES